MRDFRRILILLSRVLLTVFVLSLVPVSVFAEDGSGEMTLKRGFLSSTKFTVGNSEPKPVFGFTGTSFKPEFVEAISIHPTALEEAKKSLTWNGVGFVGSLTLLAGAIWLLSDTLSDASDVSSGQLVEDDVNWGPVVVVGAGAVIMLVGSLSAKSHLNKGVEIYNEAEAAGYGSLSPGTPQLHVDRTGGNTEPLSAWPRLGIGLGSREDHNLSGTTRGLQAVASLAFSF